MQTNKVTPARVLCLSAIIFLLPALVSCFSPYRGEGGNLVLTISESLYGESADPSGGRAIWTGINIPALTHTVKVSGGSGPMQYRSGVKAGDKVLFNVAPGRWEISIEGFEGSAQRSRGSAAVEVRARETTHTRIEMERVFSVPTILINTDFDSSDGEQYFTIAGTGAVTIDWGGDIGSVTGDIAEQDWDMSSSNGTTLYYIPYEYDQPGTKTIAITGNITWLHTNRTGTVSAIDASGMSSLEYLNCSGEKLTSLDVRNNSALIRLECYENQLTSLDVSDCSALIDFLCHGNQLTSLDVSGCTALNGVNCHNNQLTSLNVSGLSALDTLYCYDNQLTSLDVTRNSALEYFFCYDNQLTSLDVTRNNALMNLQCYGNQLTSLDVSGKTALFNLECNNNQLTSLNVSGCTALFNLVCANNHLNGLDVSGFTALKELDCNTNQLSSLNVSGCTTLAGLKCGKNQLASLDVSGLAALVNLQCLNNQFQWQGLNDLFDSLYNRTSDDVAGTVYIGGNPGTEDPGTVRTKATSKNWGVNDNTVYDS